MPTRLPSHGNPSAAPATWSSSGARAHAVVVSVLTLAEILIAARRLVGARPHLAAVAGIVRQENLWQMAAMSSPVSTSAPGGGISAATGSVWSSGPRRGSGSFDVARRPHAV